MAAEREDLDRAGVLAERQDALGGDDRVPQDRLGHEAVVAGRLGIVEDPPHGRQEVRAQVEGEVGEGLPGEGLERAVGDAQRRPAAALGSADAP